MSTITRSASVVTLTFGSSAEMQPKLDSLRTKLQKLPPLASGRKRNFCRKGLVLEIPVSVYDELIQLQTREAVKQQLISEMEQPSQALLDAEKALLALAELRLPDSELEDHEPLQEVAPPSLDWSKEQIQLYLLENGITYKKRMTKEQLLNLIPYEF